MDHPKSRPSSSSSSSSSSVEPHPMLQQAFCNFQANYSSFIKTISTHLPHCHSSPFLLPNPPNLSSIKAHLQSAISGFKTDAAREIQAHFGRSPKTPNWARIALPNGARNERGYRPRAGAMSTEAIEQRLEGVPVYTLTNADGEIVLLSNVQSGKSLGLLCLREEDAQDILEEMWSMYPDKHKLPGSKVIPVALKKVFQLRVNGVAFRLIPEVSQVLNALKEMGKAGSSQQTFSGVPVFQSQNLTLISQNKRYQPLFFRKEDLESSLLRAHRPKSFNIPLRPGDIEVAVLEEIIRGMEDASCSKWDNAVFIPPGFDVSTDLSQLEKDHK